MVGGAATAVALVLFNVLVHGLLIGTPLLADRPIAAYIAANSIGMLVSYHGSRTYAFRDRPARGTDGGFSAYVVINLATMTIPVLCLAVSRDVLALDDPVSDNLAANVVGALLGLVARFYLFRTFVFRRPIHLSEIYDPESYDPESDDPESDDEPTLNPEPGASTDPSTTGRVIPPAA